MGHEQGWLRNSDEDNELMSTASFGGKLNRMSDLPKIESRLATMFRPVNPPRDFMQDLKMRLASRPGVTVDFPRRSILEPLVWIFTGLVSGILLLVVGVWAIKLFLQRKRLINQM